MLGAADFKRDETVEAANAVFFMYDQFAFRQAGGLGQKRIGLALFAFGTNDALAE
ncbi:MAG: hypothetical protein LRY51_12670 [Geovibrio sp.]|nr:hypothetical protein [Geovibrio sp.]